MQIPRKTLYTVSFLLCLCVPAAQLQVRAQAPCIVEPASDAITGEGTEYHCLPAICSGAPDCYRPRMYGRLEALAWCFLGQSIPVLVATIPLDTMNAFIGKLFGDGGRGIFSNFPFPLTVFGDTRAGGEARPGARVLTGWRLDPEETCGIELGGFYIGGKSAPFHADLDGHTPIGRPISGSVTYLAATPLFHSDARQQFDPQIPMLAGRLNVTSSSQLWGGEVSGWVNVFSGQNARLDLLGGYRYCQLREELDIGSVSARLPLFAVQVGVPPPTVPLNSLGVTDFFATRNQLNAGQVGLRGQVQLGRLSFEAATKFALGGMQETVEINGVTVQNRATGPVTLPGGLYALQTNIGQYSRNRFGALLEVDPKISWQATDTLRFFLGYSYLAMLTNVVRPGDQINTAVDINYVPANSAGVPGRFSPTGPFFQFHESTFWAQGVTFGLELQF